MFCSQPIFKVIISSLAYTAMVGGLGLGTVACSTFSQAQNDQPQTSVEVIPPVTNIVALGRLAPKGEIIKLSVPNAEDSRVNKILVEEGDKVKAEQVIAILQGFERRQRDLEEAKKNVEFFRARLDQTKSGDAKQAEIAAQRANISRLQAQLRTETAVRKAAIASAEATLRQAETNYQRRVSLENEGAISSEEKDLAKEQWETAQATLEQVNAQLNNTVETLQEQINQEQKNLARLQEVRPVDIRVAEVELERAMIAVEQRKADLDDTKVRVPVAGQILRINTRVGEQVNTQQGIVELGQTDQMYAIAEVYETEIGKVRLGQTATVTSEYGGFEGKVRGIVEHIGLQVGARQISEGSSNPTTDENTRVVEVKIRIDPEDNDKVSRLTSMQVRVEIENDE